jgi:hypothetical protein
MKNAKRSSVFLAVAAAAALAGCNDYNKIVSEKVKKALGADFAHYQIFSYPTNNFGAGTLYRTTDNQPLCDMWNCLGVDDKKIPAEFNEWKRLDSKVGVGDDGAVISLTEKESREYAISAVLPKISDVLKLGVSLDGKNVTKVELQLGRAYPRRLRVQEWQDYMKGVKSDSIIGTAFRDGNLTVTVGDVVIESIKAKVTVDSSVGPKMDAAIDAPVGVSKIIKDGAKLEVKATRGTEGVYSFEITRPVIVLQLSKKQPGGGVLSSDTLYKTWGDASVPDNSK